MTARDDAMEEMRAALEDAVVQLDMIGRHFNSCGLFDGDRSKCDCGIHEVLAKCRAAKALDHVVEPNKVIPTPPSDESPVGDTGCDDDKLPGTVEDWRTAARRAGVREFNEFIPPHSPLFTTPQPERVTEARVEAAAAAYSEASASHTPNPINRFVHLPAMRAALEAALSISSEGEGGEFVLVPRELTEPMLAALDCGGDKAAWPSAEFWKATWRTLLAALPRQGERT